MEHAGLNTALPLRARSARKIGAALLEGPASIVIAIPAVLSVLSVWKVALCHRYSNFIERVIEAYGEYRDQLFAPLEPIVREVQSLLQHLLDVKISMADGWKDIFILLWFWFIADCAYIWSLQQRATAIFHMVLGVLLAALACVAYSLETSTDHPYWVVTCSTLPAWTMLSYTIIGSSWRLVGRVYPFDKPGMSLRKRVSVLFDKKIWRGLQRTLLQIAVACMFLCLPWTWQATLPAILVSVGLILFMSLYWLAHDRRVLLDRTKPLEERIDKYLAGGGFAVGWRMFRTFLVAGGVIAVDAALRTFSGLPASSC